MLNLNDVSYAQLAVEPAELHAIFSGVERMRHFRFMIRPCKSHTNGDHHLPAKLSSFAFEEPRHDTWPCNLRKYHTQIDSKSVFNAAVAGQFALNGKRDNRGVVNH